MESASLTLRGVFEAPDAWHGSAGGCCLVLSGECLCVYGSAAIRPSVDGNQVASSGALPDDDTMNTRAIVCLTFLLTYAFIFLGQTLELDLISI